jgi:endoglucanase
MLLRLLTVFIMLILVGFNPLAGQCYSQSVRLPLSRGVNIDRWLEGKNIPANPLTTITAAELSALRKAGFDHVRLPIDVPFLADDTLKFSPQKLKVVDTVIRRIFKSGMNVVFDLHPTKPFKQRLYENPEDTALLAQLWQELLTHYQKKGWTQRMAFELLNEPHFEVFGSQPAQRWENVQQQLYIGARKGCANCTLILKGHSYDTIRSLPKNPIQDSRAYYSIHYYEPFFFTHQGAHWLDVASHVGKIQHLPYPVNDSLICLQAASGPTPESVKTIIKYCSQSFGISAIQNDFRKAAQWSAKHRIPLYLGEFGVIQDSTRPNHREQWLRDVRQTAEQSRFAWAVWEYHNAFRISAKRNPTLLNPGVGNALGLTVTPNPDIS